MGMLSLRRGESEIDSVVERGLRLTADGADIIDIRPPRASEAFEFPRDRLDADDAGPVIRALADAGVAVSVSTTDADGAILAAEHGASYINDVSGGSDDPFMAQIVAASGLKFIAGYRRPRMKHSARHVSIPNTSAVADQLRLRIDAMVAAGLAPRNLILDVGPGLAENPEEDWRILEQFDALTALGFPLLITPSRTRFLSSLLPDDATDEERDTAALAVSILAADSGVWAARVHNVARIHHVLRGRRPRVGTLHRAL